VSSLGGLVTCRDHYDVAVIGAGAAGVAAAVAAAGASAHSAPLSVALIEASHRLGGAVTAAMHRSLCGLYAAEPHGPLDTLNAGTQRELIARMVALSPASVVPRKVGKTWVLEFPADAWETALNDISTRSNVDRLLGCKVSEIRRKNGRISDIRVDGAVDRQIGVRVLIDCTGGGAAIGMCGQDAALFDDASTRMLGGYSVRIAGLEGDPQMLRVQIPYVLTRAVLDGKLPSEARFTMFLPGPGFGEGICKLAVNPARFAQEDVELFASQVLEHLKGQLPAFANSRVVEASPRALARDGVRLRGKYVVTEADVLEGRRLDSQDVRAWWPIERWCPEQGPTYAYPPQGVPYGIPCDAFRSAVIDNLLAAGTCVSATSAAAASLRASGICLATGHAAGVLAASLLNRPKE
jgi:hypothetical protein